MGKSIIYRRHENGHCLGRAWATLLDGQITSSSSPIYAVFLVFLYCYPSQQYRWVGQVIVLSWRRRENWKMKIFLKNGKRWIMGCGEVSDILFSIIQSTMFFSFSISQIQCVPIQVSTMERLISRGSSRVKAICLDGGGGLNGSELGVHSRLPGPRIQARMPNNPSAGCPSPAPLCISLTTSFRAPLLFSAFTLSFVSSGVRCCCCCCPVKGGGG